MVNTERQLYWEHIYQSKALSEVGWYQQIPVTSLELVRQFHIPVTSKIIDVGGGDSYLVDHLLKLGFRDITVLDISETAIARAKARLGKNADLVKWIVADAADFHPTEKYDFWHDRAAFHFLTTDAEVEKYIDTAQHNINPGGIMVIGTFSEKGPAKCSGLDIRQYSEDSMNSLLKRYFEKIKCFPVDHRTPANVIQHYIFCSFRKSPG